MGLDKSTLPDSLLRRVSPSDLQAAGLPCPVADATIEDHVADADPYESDLHDKILAECRRCGWIALHGSMAHRTHRSVGEFDFVILADCGRVFFIECKSRSGKLRPDQAALKAWAERLGHQPILIRSKREFLEAVK